MNRAPVIPNLLRWARERSGPAPSGLAARQKSQIALSQSAPVESVFKLKMR